MTKSEMVDQVYLAISGGTFSPDINVQRPDIENLLPAAINYAITVYNRTERRQAMEDIRIMGSGHTSVYADFITTILKTPELDEERELYFLTLPFRVQNLPGGRGLDSVAPVRGEAPYIKVASHSSTFGIPKNLPQVFWWYEDKKVYFKNLGLPVCDHLVRMVVAVSDLSGDDEIPMPSGLEFEVIKLMVDFFTGARAIPDDTVADDRESPG